MESLGVREDGRKKDKGNPDLEASSLGKQEDGEPCSRRWEVRSRRDGKGPGRQTRHQKREDLETEAKHLAVPRSWAVTVRSLTVKWGQAWQQGGRHWGDLEHLGNHYRLNCVPPKFTC